MIVRESINFERGIEPKHTMRIGKYALIKKWFDDLNIPEDEYVINSDFSISVVGSLYLSNTNITSLPDNLSVGGSLDLSYTNITSLPDNLSVVGSIYGFAGKVPAKFKRNIIKESINTLEKRKKINRFK